MYPSIGTKNRMLLRKESFFEHFSLPFFRMTTSVDERGKPEVVLALTKDAENFSRGKSGAAFGS